MGVDVRACDWPVELRSSSLSEACLSPEEAPDEEEEPEEEPEPELAVAYPEDGEPLSRVGLASRGVSRASGRR